MSNSNRYTQPTEEKVRRVPVACTNCRQNKSKCLTESPEVACRRCERKGLKCKYVAIGGSKQERFIPGGTSSGQSSHRPPPPPSRHPSQQPIPQQAYNSASYGGNFLPPSDAQHLHVNPNAPGGQGLYPAHYRPDNMQYPVANTQYQMDGGMPAPSGWENQPMVQHGGGWYPSEYPGANMPVSNPDEGYYSNYAYPVRVAARWRLATVVSDVESTAFAKESIE
ncbi:hypothetical protein FB45DRAFT_1066268 [Roridomyces roridus]|uniref:Zn(2)-C6 fungal-type domain-containing protein n=1 Tax=Roridomyces roridus TaxID=1738132 RepID=A0AAD7B5I4_9AGAR|nr:hypothetical protein FB45DRAFT_1066268 [Roridomyces roridus]